MKISYFQIIIEDEKNYLKIHPSEDDKVDINDIINYFDKINFPDYDIVSLDAYIKSGDFDKPFFLSDTEIFHEGEKCIIDIAPNGTVALAKFYPPIADGSMLTLDEIVADLKQAGVKHGIRKKAIQYFLDNHEYDREYILAKATLPIHGHDAKIQYHFDIYATAKPKLNEDGSVDFHDLGNIKAVKKGQKLATLTPMDRGRAGISVLGKTLPAKKVKNKHLKFGRNIKLSQDKCTIYSNVSGYVTLVDGMVMVSDIYTVPANVDSSTGDIDFDGTVNVTGNVSTGFKIKATGDIVVNGVVEGATLISGGNIVLKKGMQGMDRGVLQAQGNVSAKFMESCKVECNGTVKADAILHSEIKCKEKVDVLGKKGLINGGSIETYGTVHATSLGSTMGTITKITVYSDIELLKKINKLKEEVADCQSELKKIDKSADNLKKSISAGVEVLPEQYDFIKKAIIKKPQLMKDIKNKKIELEELKEFVEKNKNSCIKVEGDVYPGVHLEIKDVMMITHDSFSHCKFKRDGADVKTSSL